MPAMFPFVHTPAALPIRSLLNGHSEIVCRREALDAFGSRLRATQDPEERTAPGVPLSSAANGPSAYSLSQRNPEERELSPLLWKHLDDEELWSMRREIMRTGHPERIRATLGWTLAHADVGERVTIFPGDGAAGPFCDAGRDDPAGLGKGGA